MIELRHITKTYGKKHNQFKALNDINLTIPGGASVAILGKSGSGKSTLMHAISGLDRPQTGQVVIGGRDILQMKPRQVDAFRARTISFIFQSFFVEGNDSVVSNVMLPLELAGAPRARQQASEMLARVGLAARLGHYPKLLSGGEQQRVALARAFVMRPAALLADEPTGSLDFATGERVMQLMLEMNRELGTTLVLVTHDRALAALCERRLVVEAGRVSEGE